MATSSAAWPRRKAIAGVRDGMRGKAAIARVTGEPRAVAEISRPLLQ